MTLGRSEPILIYRKEDRVAGADRAGEGIVDNSIAFGLGRKIGAGLRVANPGCGVVGSHPLPRPLTR